MKTFTLITILLLLTISTKAQTYHPLPTQNAYWTVYEWDEQNYVYDDKVYSVEGDTLINEIDYTKIYKLNDYPTIYDTVKTLHCFMRQDNQARKIWFIRSYLGETSEKLGYDLSVAIGDTVSLPAFDYSFGGDSVFVLGTVDPNVVQIIDGSYRNYYGFYSILNAGHTIGFVEGTSSIGNTFPDRFFFWDAFHQSHTMCMYENGTYTWPANTWPIDSTYCGFNLVNLKDIENNELKIYPNPANNYLSIDIPANLKNGSFELTDLLGNRLRKNNIANSSTQIQVDLSSYPSGIYIFVTRTPIYTYYNKLIISH